VLGTVPPYVAGFMTICFERPVVHAACVDKVNSPERVSKLTGLPGPKTKLAIRPTILTHHSIFQQTPANSSWVLFP
jgi:hypothetical protein